jgi:CRP/FNR family transcriptional regulator
VLESLDQDALVAHPIFDGLGTDSWELVRRTARPLVADPSLFRQEGDACTAVTLLASGRVRVVKRRATGREIGLYTVEPGQLCVLEVLAVLTGTTYRAEAVIELPVTGMAIPAPIFRRLVDIEPGVRDHVFRAIEARLAMALELVGDVALGTLEPRLAASLLRLAGPATGQPLRVTHDRLARELGCAREAVSRILGAWERAGLVRLGRATLWLLDVPGLVERAAPDERPDIR